MAEEEDKFYYFAYGSHLLSSRMRLNIPSAKRIGIGKIVNHQLDFSHWSEHWHGGVTTIVPIMNRDTWGAIWQINKDHLPLLDRQKRVKDDLYVRTNMDVVKEDGKKLNCVVYHLAHLPGPSENLRFLPEDCKPSALYWKILVEGAEESGLPQKYINLIKSIQHNGYDSSANLSTL